MSWPTEAASCGCLSPALLLFVALEEECLLCTATGSRLSVATVAHRQHQRQEPDKRRAKESNSTSSMTSFDALCFLTTVDMREAELEATQVAKQPANYVLCSGDSAKGAKLFTVSSQTSLYYWSASIAWLTFFLRPVALNATLSSPAVLTRSAPTSTVSLAVRPVRSRGTPTPTPTRAPMLPGTRTLWYAFPA